MTMKSPNWQAMMPGFVLAAVATILSLIAVAKFVLPFAWVALFVGLALLTGIRYTRRGNLKALWLNLAVVVLTLGAYETWLYASRAPANRDSIILASGQSRGISGMSDLDATLGYAPVKGQSGRWTRTAGDELIFDIEYSIDSNGLRSAPADTSASDLPCVLFFGGSFTFGAGVADDETMPYQVGARTGGRYRVYNFGYRGYGPHQMLAALEHGRIDSVVDCQPRYAIYQMIRDHVRRSAGPSSWDTNGPRFVLRSDGSVAQAGTFGDDDGRQGSSGRLHEILNRSLVYRKLNLFGQKLDQDDVDLFVAIVDRARALFEQRYPGGEFHVIFWPNSHWSAAEVLEQFSEREITVHQIVDILPDFRARRTDYSVHPLDGHPNALAHGKIADYVARYILDD